MNILHHFDTSHYFYIMFKQNVSDVGIYELWFEELSVQAHALNKGKKAIFYVWAWVVCLYFKTEPIIDISLYYLWFRLSIP